MKKYVVFLFLFSILILAINVFANVNLKYSVENQPEWTILVYLNADNNLYHAGLGDLKEMEDVGSSDKMKIVVQFDGTENGDTRRYLVHKGSSIPVDNLESKQGEVDMGDFFELEEFLKWGTDMFPAKKYFAVVWNHGSGTLKSDSINHVNVPKAISFDESSGNFIDTTQLGLAIRAASDYLGRKIDLYGSDACLMAMLGVNYELKDSVDYIVGSQAVEPGNGWPYNDFLSALSYNPEMTPKQAGIKLLDSFVESYSYGSQGNDIVTLSLIDASKLNPFIETLNDSLVVLSSMMSSSGQTVKTKLSNALADTQHFGHNAYTSDGKYKNYKDLKDLIKKLKSKFDSRDEIYSYLIEMDEQLEKMVVKSVKKGNEFSAANGLSVWFPDNADGFKTYLDDFQSVNFSQNTFWVDFLSDFYDVKTFSMFAGID